MHQAEGSSFLEQSPLERKAAWERCPCPCLSMGLAKEEGGSAAKHTSEPNAQCHLYQAWL